MSPPAHSIPLTAAFRPDAPGPGTTLGYCTNVHPGRTLPELCDQLLKHACGVKDRVSPSDPLPLGLWLPAKLAHALLRDEPARVEFRDFLACNGLLPFTFNAFPAGDFHTGQVKHRVYRPEWSELSRLDYTLAIIQLAPQLNPSAREISISTLPICWGRAARAGSPGPEDLHAAARSLRSLAVELSRREEEQGVLMHIDLEPEPGCLLHTAEDAVWFFENYLLGRSTDAIVRRHIRICHDVCHAAVMFRDQAEELATYQRAGIHVGKVQVSSAPDIDFESAADRAGTVEQLRGFAEDRYLHQTVIVGPDNTEPTLYEDLPLALASAPHRGRWRIHFHTPIFASSCSGLGTTQAQILPALRAARALHDCRHFEVETYAWEVLPPEERAAIPTLADGIAQELRFAAALAAQVGGAGARP